MMGGVLDEMSGLVTDMVGCGSTFVYMTCMACMRRRVANGVRCSCEPPL